MKYIMMTKTVFLLALVFSTSLSAQILEPVKWKTSVEKIEKDVYELSAIATIEEGWHLYSQSVPEGGPIPTSFSFEENDTYKLLRYMVEEKGNIVDDPIFEMKIKYFSNKATFKQQVRMLQPGVTEIKAEVEFMVCDDARCLPPETIVLTFKIEA